MFTALTAEFLFRSIEKNIILIAPILQEVIINCFIVCYLI